VWERRHGHWAGNRGIARGLAHPRPDGHRRARGADAFRQPDYRRLAPGTLAHVRINARLTKLIGIDRLT
jgi:hypothetical protein